MELLVARYGTKTLMHMTQNPFNHLQILLIYHFDQRVIFTVEVEANVPITCRSSNYCNIDASIIGVIMCEIDIISTFVKNRLTACNPFVEIVDSECNIMILLTGRYHAQCMFSSGNFEEHGQVGGFGVQSESEAIDETYREEECDEVQFGYCYHDFINRGSQLSYKLGI